jgi:hypothetical protein
MPIKLKKTNIQYDIDTPEDGYIILGFDESGNLVTKNENGDYEPIVSDISTGNFVRLEVDYLTVGNRVSGIGEGLYSIAQGLNIQADGDTSFAQGNNAKASGLYSYARGNNVEASGELSYVYGNSNNSNTPVISSGKNSFVHVVSNSGATGALADYSAILGGRNHNIGTSATDSVIIGGRYNTVNASVLNSVVLGGSTQTATNNNTVYVPRLVLTNTSALSQDGAIYRKNDGNFYGYSGGEKRLNLTLTSDGANRVAYSTGTGNLDTSSSFTYIGSTLKIGSGNGTLNGVTLNNGAITAFSLSTGSGTISTTGTISAGTLNSTLSSTSTSPQLKITNNYSGDASMSFTAGGDSYTMGIDNSDADKFKLYYGSSLSILKVNTIFEYDTSTKTLGIGGDATGSGMLTLFTDSSSPLDNTSFSLVTRNEKYTTAVPSRGIQIGCGVLSSEVGSMEGTALSIRFTYVNANQVGIIYYDSSGQMKMAGFAASDERRKMNIVESDFNALSTLSGITVYDFNWRKKINDEWTDEPIDGINRGYIAQRMKDIYSFPVLYDEDMDLWEVKKDEMVPLLHKAILEQQEHIESLEQRIYELENPS